MLYSLTESGTNIGAIYLLSLYRAENVEYPSSTYSANWLYILGVYSKGKYTVKEGYKVEIRFYEAPSHCATLQATSWWKHQWNLSILPKVWVFWWRVLQNIIPTNENLLYHHFLVIGNCPLCQFGLDSTCHALLWCNLVNPSWKKTCFWPLLKQVSHLGIIYVCLWMKRVLSRTDFESFSIRTWTVWHERVNIMHGKVRRPASIISTDWSVSVLQKFQHAHKSIYSMDRVISSNAPARWAAPPDN